MNYPPYSTITTMPEAQPFGQTSMDGYHMNEFDDPLIQMPHPGNEHNEPESGSLLHQRRPTLQNHPPRMSSEDCLQDRARARLVSPLAEAPKNVRKKSGKGLFSCCVIC